MRFSRKKPTETEAEKEPHTEELLAEEPGEKDEAILVTAKLACPNCGWHNVRPSLKKGPLDVLLFSMSFRAFRCRTCGHRFHTFRRAAGN